MFGEEDPDQDVSPDTEDPEAKAKSDGEHSVTETGDVIRTSTRQWAQEVDYNPSQLFNKFFTTDIQYLLKMGNYYLYLFLNSFR